MKNNTIFNRTFKVSLVAAALGLVNSALAADVACNSSSVTITGQSGVVLNQCSINPTSQTNEPEWGSLSAVTMTSSSGQLTNPNAIATKLTLKVRLKIVLFFILIPWGL